MKQTRISRIKACQSIAAMVAYGKTVSVAFVCRDEDHRRLINAYFAAIWDEIPEWMKPELMVRNTRQFKFAGGSLIRLVLRPDYLKGGTYDAVFTYGPTSDVATWLCRPDCTIAELLD